MKNEYICIHDNCIVFKIFCDASFYSKTENAEFYDVTNNDLITAIKSMNRLICYKECRKHPTCRVASCFTLTTELFIDEDVSKADETLDEERHLKRRK